MKKTKILVVEDDAIIGSYICDILNNAGYETCGPEISYVDAVNCFHKEQPDMAIIDIILAGRKSGIDFCEYALQCVEIPVIFLTSNSDKTFFEKVKSFVPSAFLAKPFNQNTLLASIELALINYSKEQKVDPSLCSIGDSFLYKKKNVYQKISIMDILYIKSDHVYNRIFIKNGDECMIRGALNDFLEKFSDCFIQIHKSTIININHVRAIGEGGVWVDEHYLPLSPTYKKCLMEKFIKF